MMARDRQFGISRRTTLRGKIGLAAAVLAGGGAIAAGTLVATNHSAPPAAKPAGYAHSYSSGWSNLNSALTSWGTSRNYSYNQLAGLTQAPTFNQWWHNNRMLAVQRGIVVLATRKFIILQSANGKLHLWLLSRNTQFQNVSTTKAGMTALSASPWAASQAMTSSNMIPTVSMLAGAPTTAAQLLTPMPMAQTVTVQVANTALTVTVTVTRSTATVNQTATMPWWGMPTTSPVMFNQMAWQGIRTVARGDLALIAGFRSHWLLHAQLVLFAPLTTQDVGGKAFTGTIPNPAATTAPVNQGITYGSHT